MFRIYKIEALSERLGSLKIMKDASKKITEYIDKISTAPANIQNRQDCERVWS